MKNSLGDGRQKTKGERKGWDTCHRSDRAAHTLEPSARECVR